MCGFIASFGFEFKKDDFKDALEHLATSDRGVALFRRHLREAIKMMENGEDPPGVTRQPNQELIVVPSGNEVVAPDQA